MSRGLYRKKSPKIPPGQINTEIMPAEVTDNMETNIGINDFRTPPNLSLSVSVKQLGPQVHIMFAFIGLTIQVVVLIYGAISQYRLGLKRNGLQVPAYGFPVLIIGTLSLAIGMFLCAQVVQTSPDEEIWEPTSPADSKSVIWLQQGQTVGDQRFGSFARWTGTAKHASRVLTPKKAEKGSPNSEKAKPFLIIIAISSAFFGFVAQFVGLRAVHASVP